MFDEKICLQTLQRTLSESVEHRRLADLPLDALQPMYREFADETFRVSALRGFKFKSLLWHMDTLKPEVRENFKAELVRRCLPTFNMIDALPESSGSDDEPQAEVVAVGAEGSLIQTGFEAVEQDRVPKPRPVALGVAPGGSMPRSDWFHKLLDWISALVT